ncbi:NADP-dependent oxidoreductase [Flavobacterium sp. AC]|uniref:NADP-dependent oxidoreductase n=1 Tax=Flavobacterium azizsancarii TaxID=2961580 RepID=A0ABT4WGI1_9FLAO|nr:NADP-dependent oxidoreductase [Flavobacterium azizsancarii]MDA6071600.1 NADP-dependent oxidoreductase [Flavobacterium azizsancarii]
MNKVILLAKRPVGKPALNDFKLITEQIPVVSEGEILLKSLYISVDPYLRGRMNDIKSYVPPFELNKPIQSAVIAEVVESKNADFKTGTFVSGNLDWKEYQVSKGKGLTKITDQGSGLSVYLGILGMTGLTAYLGLIQAGKPKAGETLVISGAAGAVGSVVGQIGKLLGCRVVGITGSDQKVTLLESKFKFDHAINYKTVTDLNEAVKKYCPQGVDVYFDNVGGEISDAVLANINKYARLPVCGAISLYNNTAAATGPRLQPLLLTKSATMTGFIVSDFTEHFAETQKKMTSWFKEGKLIYSETIIEGFDNIPQAFLDLFEGTNQGKMIVKI